MTTQKTPTNEPTISRKRMNARRTQAASPQAHARPTPSPRPAPGRPVSVSAIAVLTSAIWLFAASATNDHQPTLGARAEQIVPAAAQHELTDHEMKRLNNRAEADRRHLDSWRMEQQATEQSDEREVQRLNNRAEADRRQVEKQRDEQRST